MCGQICLLIRALCVSIMILFFRVKLIVLGNCLSQCLCVASGKIKAMQRKLIIIVGLAAFDHGYKLIQRERELI